MNLSSIIAPSFFDLHKWIKEERYTHIVCKGGRGSTKSSFISIELILNLMKYNNINAVVLRKTANTLETSVLPRASSTGNRRGLCSSCCNIVFTFVFIAFLYFRCGGGTGGLNLMGLSLSPQINVFRILPMGNSIFDFPNLT